MEVSMCFPSCGEREKARSDGGNSKNALLPPVTTARRGGDDARGRDGAEELGKRQNHGQDEWQK